MNDRWRARTTIAVACLVLLPLWLGAAWALDGTPGAADIGVGFVLIVSGLLVVVGFLCALAGVRHGTFASRAASWLCLSLMLFVIGSVIAAFVWLSHQRLA